MKKIIAFILSAIMILGVCPGVYAEEVSQAPVAVAQDEPVVVQQDLTDEIQMLFQLGILDSLNPTYDKTVTRYNFTAMLLSIINSDLEAGQDVKFDDVEEGNALYADLAVANKLGLISGPNARPDDNITYNEAVKMTICMLGYGAYAEALGGWPMGYIQAAQSNKLLSGISSSAATKFTYADAIELLHNSLSIGIMDITGVDDGVKYEILNTNILERSRNIVKGYGVLESVSSMTINSSKAPSINDILIDGVRYDAGTLDMSDSFGYNLEFYYNPDNMKIEAYIKSDNNVVTINSGAISEVTEDLRIIYFDEKSKAHKEKLELDTIFVYNGVILKKFDRTLFTKPNTTLTLIDNNDDGSYDVVLIDKTSTIVVDSVDSYKGLVYDLYNKEEQVYLSDAVEDVNVTFVDAYGNAMFVQELVKYDVLTVKKSLDGTRVHAIYSTKEVMGTIEKLSTVAGVNYVTINGESYEATPEFIEGANPEIGDYGLFGLTYDGKVAVLNPSFSGDVLRYGYLMDAWYYKEGFEDITKIKILETNNAKTIYELADKLLLNDDGRVEEVPAYDYLINVNKTEEQLAQHSDKPAQQIIQYSVDAEGKISLLKFIDDSNEADDSLRVLHYVQKADKNDTATYDANWYMRPTSLSAGGRFGIAPSAVTFYVPSTPMDDDYFYIAAAPGTIMGDGYSNPLTVYNDDKNSFIAEAMFCTYDDPTAILIQRFYKAKNFRDAFMLKEIEKVMAEDGSETYQLHIVGLISDTKKTIDGKYIVKDPQIFDNAIVKNSTVNRVPVVGDVIDVRTDINEEIVALEIVYGWEDNTFADYTGINNGSIDSSAPQYVEGRHPYRISRGEFYTSEGSFYAFVPGDIENPVEGLEFKVGNPFFEIYNMTNFNIYVYDAKAREEKVRAGSVSELIDYIKAGYSDRVILKTYGQAAGVVFIYKK